MTAENEPGGPCIARPWLVALVLLTVVHLALGYSRNYIGGPDDDRLWLYETGSELGQAARAAALTDEVLASMTSHKVGPKTVMRFEARRDYHRNYVAASALYKVSSVLTRMGWEAPTLGNYPDFLARAAVLGYGLAYTVCCLAVLGIAAAAGRKMLFAVACAISLAAGLDSIFDVMGDTFAGPPYLMPKIDEPRRSVLTQLVRGVGAMLVNPQTGFSPFGDTPRNHFLLLSFAVFALRWSNRRTASYALLLAMSFLHQSMTGFLTVMLITTDVILFPESFRSWLPRLLMLAILATFAVRETLDTILQLQPFLLAILLAVAILLGVVSATGPIRSTFPGLWARWSALRAALASRGPIAAELMVLAALCAGVHVVTFVGNQFATPFQSTYFLAQASGRLLAILRPALLLGLTLWGLGAGRVQRQTVAVMIAALLLGPGVVLARHFNLRQIEVYAAKARLLDEETNRDPDWSRIGRQTEVLIYYALARKLDVE